MTTTATNTIIPMSTPNNPKQPISWGLLDLLDPVQLGVLHEMLQANAAAHGLNKADNPYLVYAQWVADGIDANCGWEHYCNGDAHNKPLQPYCRQLADYDNRMNWNPPAATPAAIADTTRRCPTCGQTLP